MIHGMQMRANARNNVGIKYRDTSLVDVLLVITFIFPGTPSADARIA